MKYLLIVLFVIPFIASSVWNKFKKEAPDPTSKVQPGQIWLETIRNSDNPFDEGVSGYDSIIEVRGDYVKWKNRFGQHYAQHIDGFLPNRTITNRKSIVE